VVVAPKVEEVLGDEELFSGLTPLLMGTSQPLGGVLVNPLTGVDPVNSGSDSDEETAASSRGDGSSRQGLAGAVLPVQQYALRAAVHLWLWLDQQCALMAEEVKAAGGLLVLGSSLQESNRIELQLRGRAGRQGDPGTTQLLFDLSDPLVTTYGMGCE
jgi:preprotein translocase subunit SecA